MRKSKTCRKSITSTNSMCSPFSTTATLSPSSSTYICIVQPLLKHFSHPHTSPLHKQLPPKQPPPKHTISPRPLSLCFGSDPVVSKGATTGSSLFPPEPSYCVRDLQVLHKMSPNSLLHLRWS